MTYALTKGDRQTVIDKAFFACWHLIFMTTIIITCSLDLRLKNPYLSELQTRIFSISRPASDHQSKWPCNHSSCLCLNDFIIAVRQDAWYMSFLSLFADPQRGKQQITCSALNSNFSSQRKLVILLSIGGIIISCFKRKDYSMFSKA